MRAMLALAILSCGSVALGKSGGPATLGRVNFPVTGSEAARVHFSRGVAALHSFWYEEARDEFREATRAQPGSPWAIGARRSLIFTRCGARRTSPPRRRRSTPRRRAPR